MSQSGRRRIWRLVLDALLRELLSEVGGKEPSSMMRGVAGLQQFQSAGRCGDAREASVSSDSPVMLNRWSTDGHCS